MTRTKETTLFLIAGLATVVFVLGRSWGHMLVALGLVLFFILLDKVMK